MGAVLFVLLIVCANVAAARAGACGDRDRVRWRCVRRSARCAGASFSRLLIEHAMLGLVGGVVGLFVAWAGGARNRRTLGRSDSPRGRDAHATRAIFAFAIGASLVAGVRSGHRSGFSRDLAVSPRDLLASGGRTSARGGRNLAGASLVTLEIALALLLLTGAGLLIRSFRSVMERDLGFDTNVATAEVALTGPRFVSDTIRRYAYWDSLHRVVSRKFLA